MVVNNKSSPSSTTSSWLDNQNFSGNLRELFTQIADSNINSPNNDNISNDSSFDNSNRPSAIDYFNSDSSDIDDNDEIIEYNNHNISKDSKYSSSYNINDNNNNDDNLVWVEKQNILPSKLTGKRKRKISKESLKSRKKQKKYKNESIYSKKSSKKKLKEKEKLLKIEEKIQKEYGYIKRSNNYHWGTVIKDPLSDEYISVKENPLQLDNQYYFWDPKSDNDLLMYEQSPTSSIPIYYHAPKRFLGLQSNETARYLKQHQTYLITRNDISSAQHIDRYFMQTKKRNKTLSIIPKNEKITLNLNYIPLSDDNVNMNISKNNEDIDNNTYDNYQMKRTEELSKYTQSNPNDIQGWIRFINFQDEILSSKGNSYSKKSIIEKKMSIYLSALQKNEDSEELLIGYLDCVEKLWDTEKLIKLWEKVMIAKKYNISMWERYLSFRLSHFSSFSISECRKIFQQVLFAMYDFQIYSSTKGNLNDAIKAEEYQVEFFRRYCLFEAQSGYTERAIALYQAMIEFNINYPKNLEEYNSRLKVFESFWDSESPRIGELDSKGWNDWVDNLVNNNTNTNIPIYNNEYENNISKLINSIQDKDSFSIKLLKEHLLQPLWQPKRSIEHNNNNLDMECVILFNDIEEFILPIRMDIFKVKLICNFIIFLISHYGGHTNLLLYASDGNDLLQDSIINQNIIECESIGYDLCKLLPQHNDIITNMLAPPTSLESEYQKLLPKEYSLFDSSINEQENNIILLSNDISNFIKRIFDNAISKFPSNSNLSNLYLNFELYYNRISSRKTLKQRSIAIKNTCKQLLSKRTTDLQLWDKYAKAEDVLNHKTEAKRIYDTALSISNITSESYSLIASYALLELFNPTFNNKQITLARVLSILICTWEDKFQSIFIRKKIRDKYIINEITNDFSNYPINILPKITPIRVLQAKNKISNILEKIKQMNIIPQSYYIDQCIIILLFEYLYKDLDNEIVLFNNIITLKWKHLSFKRRLYEFQLSLLEYHSNLQIIPPKQFRKLLQDALEDFPSHPKFLASFIQHESRSQLQNRLRRYFDKHCNSTSSPIIWLFAIKSETKRIGTFNRIISLFERALEIPRLCNCSLLWRTYIQFHIHRNEMDLAKRIYFRGIRTIPYSKSLWILCTKLCLSNEETTELLKLMIEKEIRLRISL